MSKSKIIALYLPQYRPVEENDRWFGKGFTEWTSVAKTKPLFKGHIQPRVPTDLGFYDLRIPEVREEQVALAKEAGISAFCYYHYWFGNKQTILEKTLQEVVASGSPDFPFCLCWANESWYKKCWHSDTGYLSQELLFDQQYPGQQDYDEHFYFLLNTFKDKRYYKIDGRLVFVVYNLNDFKKGNVEEFKARWQQLAKENGLPEFYFISFATTELEVEQDDHKSFDATILSLLRNPVVGNDTSFIRRRLVSFRGLFSKWFNRPMLRFDYGKVYHKFSSPLFTNPRVYPVMIPNWDNSPRRGAGGTIFYNSTPENFKKHAIEILELIKNKKPEDQIVFLKSWNEWGEGNYMEPDLEYGHGYIDALREAINTIE